VARRVAGQYGVPNPIPCEGHMPTAFKTLPIIDIAGLYSPRLDERRAVAYRMSEAAKAAGFFYITGHPISRAARADLLAAARAFFDRPVEEKMSWYIGNSSNHSGYVPQGEERFLSQKPDRKEAFDVPLDVPANDPDVMIKKTPFLGPVQWPDDAEFRRAVSTYYTSVSNLARRLFAGFALALEMPEDWFEPHLKKPASQLRLIHYPFSPDAPVDEPGIGAHTDYECFTILLPTAPGLEVMNGDGEWIDAPPVEDSFVVNIGDMLETWTNGTFAATSHRVRKVQQERYSFPYFAACDYQTVVYPLSHFISNGNPRKYEALVAGDHLFAQTVQTFGYLKKQLAEGKLKLPDSSRALSSFGPQARTKKGVRWN
jgi:isopenicillin N synthase-like dioxygenase